jgi:predicted Zn-dependent peptidase
VLQDMVLRPVYTDIDSERQVVIEEIAMYEDEPQDKVHDVLAGAIFGDHPLGRPIIGRADVVSSVPVPEIASWHDGRYVPPNIVLAAAGNLEHERIVQLAEAAVGGSGLAPPAKLGAPERHGQVLRFHQKETEQYHLCLGGLGVARGDDRRFALRVLDTILGGSTSSRLFQEVREKRGLAYSVYSYASHYADSGQVALYVGTRPDNVAEAVDVIGSELRRLHDDGVDEQELERARDNVKGRTVLSMESTLTRMNRLGSSVLMGVPLLTVDELLAAFDAVTLDDVNGLAKELWVPERMSAAGVGGDEATFRSALEAVSPVLAEAA